MTLYQFNLLNDDEEKLAAVLLNGECIGMRDEDGHKLALYQLPTFYVEISTGGKPKRELNFRAFSSLELLDPYLGCIDISDIV
jgi:hypothetical protein